jgi:hypothetical protein
VVAGLPEDQVDVRGHQPLHQQQARLVGNVLILIKKTKIDLLHF